MRGKKCNKALYSEGLNMKRCKEENNMNGNGEHSPRTPVNCYSTHGVRLQLSLGVGNRQSRNSNKCWADKGWEDFKVIGNG